MRQIFVVDLVDDLFGGQSASIGQNVQNIEVKRDILIGKALGFEGFV